MKYSKFFPLILLTIPLYSNAETFTHDGHTYELIQTARTWAEASADAQSRTINGASGYLTRITSQAENTAIFNHVSTEINNGPTAPDGGNAVYVWLGASDSATEDRWIWNNGTHFWQGEGTNNGGGPIGNHYNNWGGNVEPDDWITPNLAPNGQDAAGMAIEKRSWPWGQNSQWNDIVIDNKLYYVVEYDAIAGGGLPSAATLTSPKGSIADTTPTYSWNAVANSSWYYLWVNDSTGNKVKNWYTAAQSGCSNGAGTCSVTPAATLASGSSQWWLQTWNSTGYGPWSSVANFSISSDTPIAATLISPNASITDTTPTYTWNAVANSSWYYLWVNDSSGNKVTKWYTATQAGCSTGTGTCSITPATTLALGSAKWWVQTWNNIGFGPWSSANNFTISNNNADITIYEDGVSADDWRVHNAANGATIESIFDPDRSSDVIKFTGNGVNDMYKHGNQANSTGAWGNTEQFVIHWSMKYSENFTVYIKVMTQDGRRNIYYRPQNSDQDGKKPNTGNILHGIGVSAKDGTWQTFTRDLQADLKEFDPNNEILSVDGFYIRGSGRVDDIMTLAQTNNAGVIGSGELKIEISKTQNGITIPSIKKNTLDLLSNAQTELFTLNIQNTQNSNEEIISASTGWNNVIVSTGLDTATISLSAPQNNQLPATLKAVISISTLGSTSSWDLSVSGLGNQHSLINTRYPALNIKAEGNDHFFAPYYHGKVFNNPETNDLNYSTRYPRGWGGTMQYMSYYNDNYGLYFGLHDPKASIKNFSAQASNGGIEIAQSTPAANKTRANNTWELPGHFELDLYQGDWYDAALKYRSWVFAKADYRPVDTVARLARQQKLGNTTMWLQDSVRTYTMAQLESRIRTFKDYMDIPVGVAWISFNGERMDYLFPEIFPEKPGLKGVISRLNASYGDDITFSGYMNGMLYDTENLQSYENTGKPNAIRNKNNNIVTQVFDGTNFAYMCPAQRPWQNIMTNSAQRITQEIGFGSVYVDMVTASSSRECFDPTHNHPLGGGSYWREGYKQMFHDMQTASADSPIYSEAANDFLIDEVDGFLTKGFVTNNQVPALSAVYSGKVQLIGTAVGAGDYRGNSNPDSQQFYGRVAQSFTFGAQLGRFYSLLVSSQHPRSRRAAKFIRGLGRIKAKLKDYITFGRMLRPVALNGNIPSVSFPPNSHPATFQEEVVTSAIQTSTWTDGERIAVFFVNGKVPDHAGDNISFSFDFDATKYGIQTNSVMIKEITEDSDGQNDVVNNSFTKSVTLDSYEVKAFIITPTN